MSYVRTPILTGLVMGLACTFAGDRPATSQPQPGKSVGVRRASMPFTYVGTKKCRMCHTAQYESWKESPKGQSWEALKPGHGAAAKIGAGLDPAKDYTQDASCLPCHSAGFGQPGGYAVAPPSDGKALRAGSARTGAACEACHGPGSGFVPIMEEIYRTGRTFDRKELFDAGRRVVDAAVCAQCHNEHARCMMSKSADGSLLPPVDMGVDLNDRRGYHAKLPHVAVRTPTDNPGDADDESPAETP